MQSRPRDIIMNSKSEWGYNYLPRQITEKRECTAPSEQHNINKSQFNIKPPSNSNEDERSHESNNIKDSPNAANITMQDSSNSAAQPHSDSQSVVDSFSDQYNQRRKRARLSKLYMCKHNCFHEASAQVTIPTQLIYRS